MKILSKYINEKLCINKDTKIIGLSYKKITKDIIKLLKENNWNIKYFNIGTLADEKTKKKEAISIISSIYKSENEVELISTQISDLLDDANIKFKIYKHIYHTFASIVVYITDEMVSEKLHINKDTKIEPSKKDVEEINKKIEEEALDTIRDFLAKHVDIEEESYELKITSKGDVRIYIWGGGMDFYKKLVNEWYKEGLGKKNWCYEVTAKSYGLFVDITYEVYIEDFSKVTFKHTRR